MHIERTREPRSVEGQDHVSIICGGIGSERLNIFKSFFQVCKFGAVLQVSIHFFQFCKFAAVKYESCHLGQLGDQQQGIECHLYSPALLLRYDWTLLERGREQAPVPLQNCHNRNQGNAQRRAAKALSPQI